MDFPRARAPGPKPVNLALQGGGAHGAFTWGVLDRLLEDERLRLEGVSGTSAGAMNAVVLAVGLCAGGREDAREALAEFWRAVSRTAASAGSERAVLDRLLRHWSIDGLRCFSLDGLAASFSPYDFNPFDINPLRDDSRARGRFRRGARLPEFKLFVSATNVHTGEVRVFRRARSPPTW